MKIPKIHKIQSLLEIAPDDVIQANNKIYKQIEAARFSEAFRLAKKLHQKYPRDFLVTRIFAMLMADSAEAFAAPKRHRLKKKACDLLKPLFKVRLGQPPAGVPIRDYFMVRNEYYFHSGRWDKQAKLGQRFKHALPAAQYCICVGFAWHGARYYCNGNMRKARECAQKSMRNSRNALKAYPKFYNLQVHLALAAGILNGPRACEKHLRKASRLSGRPLNYYEFQEIRDVLAHKKLKDVFRQR